VQRRPPPGIRGGCAASTVEDFGHCAGLKEHVNALLHLHKPYVHLEEPEMERRWLKIPEVVERLEAEIVASPG
jgi:hypothetical protein